MSELEESPSTEDTVEVNETEVSAREMGWRPEEEYEGPEGNWVNADEFVARAPLYDGLSKQKKRIKRLEKVVNELSTNNRNITAAQKEARIKEQYENTLSPNCSRHCEIKKLCVCGEVFTQRHYDYMAKEKGENENE